MPRLSGEIMAGSEQPTALTLTADNGALFALQLGLVRDFLDLSLFGLPFDMSMLLGLTPQFTLTVGVIDQGGFTDIAFPIPPDATLWGSAIPIQAIVFNIPLPPGIAARFTNGRDLLIVP
jgi:hypothetical protein